MVRYKIETEFEHHKDAILRMIEDFEKNGTVIRNDRNVIKKINSPIGIFVIKCFKGMYFFNKLAYSTIRPSKAIRSYQYSKQLHEKGIIAPKPVAYVDKYQSGLLQTSYFVSVYHPYENLYELIRKDVFEKEHLLKSIARFTKQLHEKGIYHRDYSSGNILVKKTEGDFEFALVDLNRISFFQPNYWQGLKNFSRITLPEEHVKLLIREYASLHGESPEKSISYFYSTTSRAAKWRKIRKKIRSLTLSPIEAWLKKRKTSPQ